jgi:hypothetical protein
VAASFAAFPLNKPGLNVGFLALRKPGLHEGSEEETHDTDSDNVWLLHKFALSRQ